MNTIDQLVSHFRKQGRSHIADAITCAAGELKIKDDPIHLPAPAGEMRGALFYSYDPENGIQFHKDAKEAKGRAEQTLDDAEFHAADSDWSWNENEEEISWGVVYAKVNYNDRDLTPEERSENPEFVFHRSPTLDNVRAALSHAPEGGACPQCADLTERLALAQEAVDRWRIEVNAKDAMEGEITEIQRMVGCGHVEGLARCVRDALEPPPDSPGPDAPNPFKMEWTKEAYERAVKEQPPAPAAPEVPVGEMEPSWVRLTNGRTWVYQCRKCRAELPEKTNPTGPCKWCQPDTQPSTGESAFEKFYALDKTILPYSMKPYDDDVKRMAKAAFQAGVASGDSLQRVVEWLLANNWPSCLHGIREACAALNINMPSK